MAFGFPAYYKNELKRSDLKYFRERLEKTMEELPFSILDKSKDQIILKVDWSVWSWGEKIIIDFSQDKNVILVSRCVFPLQCYDYGKNKENVELLIDKT